MDVLGPGGHGEDKHVVPWGPLVVAPYGGFAVHGQALQGSDGGFILPGFAGVFLFLTLQKGPFVLFFFFFKKIFGAS